VAIDEPIVTAVPVAKPRRRSGAVLVAMGMFLSRIAGLVRERVFAHYFGNSAAADAFKAAFRIPNFLQNLFGEGTLSASFIPVYAKLLAEGDEKQAGRVAGAIFAILTLMVSFFVLVGVLVTPYLIAVIAPGFTGAKRELTIQLVRILFPGIGLLVLSAWCLGILNSHRRFFLSYAAPVMWNLVMITALIYYGPRMGQFPLAIAIAWASVAGSALQFLVQLPFVLKLARGLRFFPTIRNLNVRSVVKNFVPVFFSRGAIQISGYIDGLIASLLPTGAFAAFSYAQTLYLLPFSLFGMSISASELPVMSSALGNEAEVIMQVRDRLQRSLRRIAFLIVPSAMAFIVFGDVVAGAIYQTGRFGRSDAIYVWPILAGAGAGLMAGTFGRLYASAYYALRDTRTPLRFALLRVGLGAGLGFIFSLLLPPAIGIHIRWGVAGLTLASTISSWVEFRFLRHSLNRRIGPTGLEGRYLLSLIWAAGAGAAGGWLIKWLIGPIHPILAGIAILGVFGGIYLLICRLGGISLKG